MLAERTRRLRGPVFLKRRLQRRLSILADATSRGTSVTVVSWPHPRPPSALGDKQKLPATDGALTSSWRSSGFLFVCLLFRETSSRSVTSDLITADAFPWLRGSLEGEKDLMLFLFPTDYVFPSMDEAFENTDSSVFA